MYNHGVATIALAELYGQTQAADIKPKLDRAIRLIHDLAEPRGRLALSADRPGRRHVR
jgi:hypothetical protein